MSNVEIWHSGIGGYIEKKLETGDKTRKFTYTISEPEFEPNRHIFDIFYDHFKDRGTKTVEILYSGGVDSELALLACIHNKIPCEAVTMAIRARGALVNIHDMYYSEKFCRENNIKHRVYTLNVEDFFYSERYKEYIDPYSIVRAHVASHFWIIEQCNSFPVMGGDWPWVKMFMSPRICSPQRLDYNCYDKFMRDKGITGIGSNVANSFESAYRFMQLQIEHAKPNEQTALTSAFLKQKMYPVKIEPRLRSYGWEECPQLIFDVDYFNNKTSFKNIEDVIVWGDKLKQLMNTTASQSNTY